MTLAIKLSNANFTAAGLPKAVYLNNGYTSDQLKSLYLMADANPAVLIADTLGDSNTALQTAANQNTGNALLANGGLRIRGLTRFLGPQIDLSQPYTVFFAGRHNVPDQYTGAGYIGASIVTDQYEGYQRGFALYSIQGAFPEDGAQLPGLTFRPTNKGAQDGPNTKTFAGSANLKWSRNIVEVLRHTGNGEFNFKAYSSVSGADVDAATVLPYPQIITGSDNTQDPLQRIGLGVRDPIWQSTDLNVETFAVYTKALTDAELLMNVQRAFTLIASRGR